MKKMHFNQSFILIFIASSIIFGTVFNQFPRKISQNSRFINEELNFTPKSATSSFNVNKVSDILDGSGENVVIQDSTAFVAAGCGGLKIIDFSDPSQLSLIGEHDNGGIVLDLQIAGMFVYLADERDGLEIINISDPCNPEMVGHTMVNGTARRISVMGIYAYIVVEEVGMYIIDISNPENPLIVGIYAESYGQTYDVYVVGTIAYLVRGQQGIVIINVSNPAQPVKIGEYFDLSLSMRTVEVVGTIAYVTSWSDGLILFDISTPSAPIEIERFNDGAAIRNVQISGLDAYVVDTFGLKILNLSDPMNVTKIGEFNTDYRYGISIQGSYAILVGREVEIIDISNPSNPTYVNIYNFEGATHMHIVGTLAYVTNIYGLMIIDIADPLNPSMLGNYSISGSNNQNGGIWVSGSYAYLVSGLNTYTILDIFDVSNPNNPILADSSLAFIGGAPKDIIISGSYAYLALGRGGLHIVNISDPLNPQKVSSINLGGSGAYARDLHIQGDYAYIANDGYGLEIVDISNLSSPEWIARYHDGGYVEDVHISGSFAYLADRHDGLEVIDISNPAVPFEVAQYSGEDTYSYTYSVEVSGKFAYLADSVDGLEIIDISNHSRLYKAGAFDDGWGCSEVQVNGQFIYTAGGLDGLEILNQTEVVHSIVCTNPINSDIWNSNTQHMLTWTSTGPIASVDIKLYRDSIYERTIVSDTSNDGSYMWNIPAIDMVDSPNYQIRIEDSHDHTTFDYSEEFELRIHHSLTIVSPNETTVWEKGTVETIEWIPTGAISRVDIDLFLDGLFFQHISANVLNNKSYSWLVPSDIENSNKYSIRISDTHNSSTYDISIDFEIRKPRNPISIPGYSSVMIIGIIMVISGILWCKYTKIKACS